jgi:peptidase E
LFSSPPEPFPAALLDLARQLLAGKTAPLVGYLPAGSLERHFVREVKGYFRDIAEVSAMKPEVHTLARIRSLLRRADLLLIPGGNTYLMAHRLHAIGLLPELRQRLLDGLPLVTISAGTLLCGLDILTTNDINCCGCTQFSGLSLAPCNFNVHYPSLDGPEREERDQRIAEYQAFHPQPVLALEDGACLRLAPGHIQVLGGRVWKFVGGSKESCVDYRWQD